jgi:hypothetical protein
MTDKQLFVVGHQKKRKTKVGTKSEQDEKEKSPFCQFFS